MAKSAKPSGKTFRSDDQKRDILAKWETSDNAGKRAIAEAEGVAFTSLTTSISGWRKKLSGQVTPSLGRARSMGTAFNATPYSTGSLNRVYASQGADYLRGIQERIDGVLEAHRVEEELTAKYQKQKDKLLADSQLKLDALNAKMEAELETVLAK